MNPGNRMLLLLIDSDSARAAEVEGHLRHLGSAVHASRCDHVGALDPSAPAFDLCVIALDGAASLAAAGLSSLRDLGQSCPVLALGQPEFECSLGAILAHGFSDWVGTDDPLHLREAARRELKAARARSQSQQLRAALLDSERRIEVIMHNTRDAHAVVIDGVHASANNPYMRALQLDPERTTSTPYLDCIKDSEREAVRALLRAFSRGEVDEKSCAQTFVLPDGKHRSLETRYSAWVGDGERGVLVSLLRSVKRRDDALTRGQSPKPDATKTSTPAPPSRTHAVAQEAAAGSTALETPALTEVPAPPPRVRRPQPPVDQSIGGLAAELDQTQVPVTEQPEPAAPAAAPVHAAPATSEPPENTAAALRERLRQSIRQNTLQIDTQALRALRNSDGERHLRVELVPGELLKTLDDGEAVRRVAARIGLAGALDRWQLFVASRLSARGTRDRRAAATRLHISLCDTALHDETLPGWLKQLAGQFPQLRHTLWLPLPAARQAPDASVRFRDQLDAIGMRLCLTDAFQSAGDLTDLRTLKPHDVCLHTGVITAWAEGRFSSDNVQRLTTLLESQGIQTFGLDAQGKLDVEAATRLGFCLISQQGDGSTPPTKGTFATGTYT
ncbi:MAG: EAL domain-containing protein [Pseudomonadota bacterium]